MTINEWDPATETRQFCCVVAEGSAMEFTVWGDGDIDITGGYSWISLDQLETLVQKARIYLKTSKQKKAEEKS